MENIKKNFVLKLVFTTGCKSYYVAKTNDSFSVDGEASILFSFMNNIIEVIDYIGSSFTVEQWF